MSQKIKQPDNIIIYRGSDFERTFTARNFDDTVADLTGAINLVAQIFKTKYTNLIDDFAFVIIDAVTGQCKISLTGAETLLLDFKNELYYYKANLTLANNKIILAGYGEVKEVI